jgi:hypothetical protein
MTADERYELDYASRAAEHVLAMTVAANPTTAVTPARHGHGALLQAVAAAVDAPGGER